MLRKLVLVSLVLLSQGADAWQKKKPAAGKSSRAGEINYKLPGAPLPPLQVITAPGKRLTEKNLDSLGNVFVMLFNPTCDHCQDVTRTLEAHIDRFREGQVVLVAASGMLPYLDFFDATTHYRQYPKLWVGVDSSALIDRIYTYASLPQINIYNKQRQLVKTFTGAVPIDSLMPYIR